MYTLPETNSSQLKMDSWNTLGWPIFRCELFVSVSVNVLPHEISVMNLDSWLDPEVVFYVSKINIKNV